MVYINKYQCPYCGERDLSEEEINKHIATSHPMQHGFENILPKVMKSSKPTKIEGDDLPRK